MHNQADNTKCDPPSTCPTGSFRDTDDQCALCSALCETCSGPSPSDCITCPSGSSMFNGKCATVDSDGVCEGTNGMIADNNKQACDSENYLFITKPAGRN